MQRRPKMLPQSSEDEWDNFEFDFEDDFQFQDLGMFGIDIIESLLHASTSMFDIGLCDTYGEWTAADELHEEPDQHGDISQGKSVTLIRTDNLKEDKGVFAAFKKRKSSKLPRSLPVNLPQSSSVRHVPRNRSDIRMEYSRMLVNTLNQYSALTFGNFLSKYTENEFCLQLRLDLDRASPGLTDLPEPCDVVMNNAPKAAAFWGVMLSNIPDAVVHLDDARVFPRPLDKYSIRGSAGYKVVCKFRKIFTRVVYASPTDLGTLVHCVDAALHGTMPPIPPPPPENSQGPPGLDPGVVMQAIAQSITPPLPPHQFVPTAPSTPMESVVTVPSEDPLSSSSGSEGESHTPPCVIPPEHPTSGSSVPGAPKSSVTGNPIADVIIGLIHTQALPPPPRLPRPVRHVVAGEFVLYLNTRKAIERMDFLGYPADST